MEDVPSQRPSAERRQGDPLEFCTERKGQWMSIWRRTPDRITNRIGSLCTLCRKVFNEFANELSADVESGGNVAQSWGDRAAEVESRDWQVEEGA